MLKKYMTSFTKDLFGTTEFEFFEPVYSYTQVSNSGLYARFVDGNIEVYSKSADGEDQVMYSATLYTFLKNSGVSLSDIERVADDMRAEAILEKTMSDFKQELRQAFENSGV